MLGILTFFFSGSHWYRQACETRVLIYVAGYDNTSFNGWTARLSKVLERDKIQSIFKMVHGIFFGSVYGLARLAEEAITRRSYIP